MKNIYRFFVSALVLFAFTVACNPPEINEPDNPSNPEQTGYTITASIVQTRVSYDDSTDGEKLEQKWEENDILFGFYGGDISKKIIFKVSSVNGGVATLDPVDGWEGEDGLGNAADETEVNLVYTGANINSIEEFDFSKGLSVDMSSQSINRIPACMHSKASLEEDNGNKSIDFKFINDCAIIEISGLSGIKEQEKVSGSSTISSIAVTNLLLEGTYSYQIDEDSGKGELVFVGGKNTTSSHSITLGDGWSVDEDGDINNTAGNLLLIAAAPNSDAKEINVTATISGMAPCTYSYGEKSLQAGNCYVINAAPVVATVEQGSSSQVFATVYEAFCYAEGLEQNNGDITVTLLRDCGLGRHFDPGVDIDPLSVYIWYKVSLDLNGHVLTLSGDYQEDDNEDTTYDKSESFFVTSENSDYETRGELTIKDSSPYQTGAIISESNTHLILNSGDVIINDGTVKHNADWCAVRNYQKSTLVVNGGVLYSGGYFAIDNRDASVTINKGNISSGYAVINNDGKLTINGGTISSESSYNIIENSDSLKINGGTVYSSGANSAIMSDGGTVYISGGVISNSSSIAETIQILNGAECTISGGVIYSEGDIPTIGCRSEDSVNLSKLTVTWPNDKQPTELSAGTGPIIYAKGATQDKAAPISTENSEDCHEAVVKIKGGYLLSSNVVFYINDEKEIINLDLNEFGGFYSNVYKIRKDGDAGGTAESLFYDLTSSGGAEIGGKFFRADSESGGSGFYMPIFEEYTGFLYKIIPCE